VDLNSGRIRSIRYLALIPFEEEVHDSALTRALGPEDLTAASPDWRRMTTYSPGMSNSPHHAFHGTGIQIGILEMESKLHRLSPEARRQAALGLLSLWRQGGNYDAAAPFLFGLGNLERGTPDREIGPEVVTKLLRQAEQKLRLRHKTGVASDAEAAERATIFLNDRKLEWGKPTAVQYTRGQWYRVEFQRSPQGAERFILVNPADGHAEFPMPK